MFSREERLAVAKHILQQMTPQWAQNPKLRADLKNFVNTGSVESFHNVRIASLLREIQANPQAIQNRVHIQQLLQRYGIPINMQDEQTRSVMKNDTLADEQIALMPQENHSVGSKVFSSIPNGCYIPLAFIALFACLASVQIALLFAYLVVTPDAENPIGSAFNATILILTVGAGVILWLRGQTRSPLHIVRLGILLAVFGTLIFGMFHFGLIDLEAFTNGTAEEKQQIIGSSLLLLSVSSAVIFWLRRQVMNIIWTIVLLAIIIIAIIFAVHSGIIDLESIISNIEPTDFR